AIESRLQSHGVPAHQVQNSADAYADPQFVHRGHFVALDHPSLGKFTVEGPRAKLSRTPAAVRRAAPSLGQDNQHVLESILGYNETQISELVASGALG
ncbi:MAG TPA: CoA transferase, partial [Candidatus Binatus sp.]|nr:CoA transferase [Candidatus Binatus sp.]